MPGSMGRMTEGQITAVNLVEQLHENGMPYIEVAERLGVTVRTVRRWRQGEARPPLSGMLSAELSRLLEQVKTTQKTTVGAF